MLLTAGDAAVEQPPAEGDAAASAPRFVLPGSAVGQDGRSSALTAPNGPAQRAVIIATLEAAVLRPSDIASLQVKPFFYGHRHGFAAASHTLLMHLCSKCSN